MNIKIGGTFQITKKLGSGSFGDIFLGINSTNNSEVAVKLEKKNCSCPQLLYEFEIYNHLLSNENLGECGLPFIYHAAQEGDYNYMVMEKLGLSLEYYFAKMRYKFSTKTVVMLAF